MAADGQAGRANWIGGDADQSEKKHVRNFWPIFGSRWPLTLFGTPWPSPGLPGLRFNSLDLRESGLDLAETKFRPKIFSQILKNQKIAFLGPKLASYGLGTVIETSGSKCCLVLVPIMSQSDFVVRLYDQITVEKSRFLLVCSTTLQCRAKFRAGSFYEGPEVIRGQFKV